MYLLSKPAGRATTKVQLCNPVPSRKQTARPNANEVLLHGRRTHVLFKPGQPKLDGRYDVHRSSVCSPWYVGKV